MFTRYGFIPRQLEIPDHPEWNVFPLNVLFMSYKQEGDKIIMGSAAYEPDFASFKCDGEIISMKYNNEYGGENWLVITHDTSKQQYNGEKFVKGQSVVIAMGKKWNMFFMHLTMLGLADGEPCVFEEGSS